jgi:hypothetical protein
MRFWREMRLFLDFPVGSKEGSVVWVLHRADLSIFAFSFLDLSLPLSILFVI